MAPELDTIIDALSRPEAYPHDVESVRVVQTHASIVFLTGTRVYKLKKPVDLGFLDYATPERRAHFCQLEVELNRPLAPTVYLGVEPLVRTDAGLRVGGTGEVLDHLVVMRQLCEDATLQSRLQAHEELGSAIELLGRRMSEFHAAADRMEPPTKSALSPAIGEHMLANFTALETQIGTLMHADVFARARAAVETQLATHRSLIDARAGSHACACHGDLRLEHVYVDEAGANGERLLIVDCIEFNDRFRYLDPVADIAFLVMELRLSGHRTLAEQFTASYVSASGDTQGTQLLPLYVAYRAMVRAKVDAIRAGEHEVEPAQREQSRRRARALALFAYAELCPAADRPCLLLIGGLPGTGKSTLAAALHDRDGVEWIRSDSVRKELAAAANADELVDGIYTEAWHRRCYDACLERASTALFAGRRVVLDANLARRDQRERFVAAARGMGLDAQVFICTAKPGVCRERLRSRVGDISDADVEVYDMLSQRWEGAGDNEQLHEIATDDGIEQALAQLKEQLAAVGLD